MSVKPKAELVAENVHQRASLARVGDVMSRPVVVIESSATLARALDRFVASRLRHLVVITDEPEQGQSSPRCLGVLADRHLASYWPLETAVLESQTVADALPQPQPYVRPDDALEGTAALMLSAGADAVCVLDDQGCVVGIVTVTDILATVAARTSTG